MAQRKPLSEQVVVITGASSGIGLVHGAHGRGAWRDSGAGGA